MPRRWLIAALLVVAVSFVVSFVAFWDDLGDYDDDDELADHDHDHESEVTT